MDFYGPSGGMDPGAAGLEDCESMSSHLATKEMMAEKYLVRHFSSIQQPFEAGGLGNASWLEGAENPADGLTEVRSDGVPLLRLPESGPFYPGQLRPLRGVAWQY